MYNRSAYNKQRYNLLHGQENEVNIRESMVETMDALVSHGEDIHDISYGIEQFSGDCFATAAVIVFAPMAEDTRSLVAAYPEYNLSLACAENVQASIFSGEDCYEVNALAEKTGCFFFLSYDSYFAIDVHSAIEAKCIPSKDYHNVPILLSELLYGSVGSRIFDYKYITLDVVIPPGGILIIDSDNYNCLLNSENVIDKQSGSWLDELSRNTFDVTIASGIAGNLEGSLLYTERYL